VLDLYGEVWKVSQFGRLISLAAVITLTSSLASAQPSAAQPSLEAPWFSVGKTVWIDTAAGPLKTRVYQSSRLSEQPVLLVLVHGDIPDPRQGLYEVAYSIASNGENVVAAGVLRPGYKDAQGDMSAGEMGYAIGDNYTPEAVDAVTAAVRELKATYHARAVVIVGHSGGGAIAANLIGKHPNDVDAALLLACGCDPREFMQRWTREHAGFPKDLPNPSLLPLDLAPGVSPRTRVRMVIGDKDDVVRLAPSEAYVNALKTRGLDATLTIAAGIGHNDVFRAKETRAAMTELLSLEGAKLQLPTAVSPSGSR
jgi:pimeloyl-ACP methyl ester carboxylesterase